MSAQRRLRQSRVCPECLQAYHPFHARQQTCSRSCGSARRHRLRPGQARAWCISAQQARYAQYKARLLSRIQGMTKLQVWNEAYQRGYSACLARVKRGAERVA